MMKLFVIDKQTKEKKYLGVSASSRGELFTILGSPSFVLESKVYHVNEVLAEMEDSNTTAGVIIGGLIGILGGPIGIITGATIGGMIGNSNDSTEKEKISAFNSSRV